MCCLFGILDYRNSLNRRQINKIIAVLAKACEARGTDATGIAYNTENKICIYKRPLPARKMNFKIPDNVHYVMGHTRMTTQGNERFNYNNHPFYGEATNTDFALAHNGVIHNDILLRNEEKLPKTRIETDSYIAVQLIEQQKTLNNSSLKYMAEKLRGSFTITVIDRDNNLYFVKGDNPMHIYHFEKLGVYIYASTKDILDTALNKMPFRLGERKEVNIAAGDILTINKHGKIEFAYFNDFNLYDYAYPYYSCYNFNTTTTKAEYLNTLKFVAEGYGIDPKFIDSLIADGFDVEEIEDMVYYGV